MWESQYQGMHRRICKFRPASAGSAQYDGGIGSFFHQRKPADMFNGIAKINNVILNMALCDLLQDDKIQRAVGHVRDEFCDARGLKRYRLVVSRELAYASRRALEGAEEGTAYLYEKGPDR